MRRLTFIIVVVLMIALVGTGAVVVNRVLLAGASPPPPLPEPVAAVAAQWSDPILLPTSLPSCLTYIPDGAAVAPDSQAGGGWALMIRLEGARTPGCGGWAGSAVLIQEGSSLASLSGPVTTVSANRLQFARLAETDAAGQTRLTLQWRCQEVMCRVSAKLDGPLTEPLLTDIAASFEPART